MRNAYWQRPSADQDARQQGVAAIEFGISIVIVLMFLFGIVSYGALFWAQQKVSYLAAEGGRYAVAQSFSNPTAAADSACIHVKKIAEQDLLLNATSNSINVTCAQTTAQCVSATCATIAVSANVSGWPLLQMMDKLIGLVPNANQVNKPSSTELTSTAVVQIM
ncbi:TadE/TadG family type IV pilus assembly protein [Allopusillimonas ginsengisoli]|uniref:TadE/TadG family type IV pilus assembly protein n=1 Tax=Allopusillimonas ginsengisoli TaxID=453575 RepID=UPI0010205520|nr:TadE/TadG family type IV pilus assembly protein [Allopusillimonas ginsengisoli]TEA80192.1 pilus assembly protein [Allopusillimonas ginsengisoli]